MKSFVVIVALVAAISASPSARPNEQSIIMTFADDGKTPIYEDLNNQPEVDPLAVDIKNVHFMLYTRSNREQSQELKTNDPTGLKNSNYNSGQPAIVLIHGWQNSHQAESVQLVKDAYLQTGDVNVILYDYEKYNSPYLTAVGNAEALGGCVATFMNYLIANGQSLKTIHLIGHSLGSHIAAYAANKIQGTVERVTGLDPAGPMFGTNKPANRISPDDAVIVDIIHSSKSLGMQVPAGTHDYFPHGGSKQPSCASNSTPDGCDHAASYRYFSETIKNRKLFPSRKCNSESDAKVQDPAQNKCQKVDVYMGQDGDKGAKGLYYVEV